MRTAWRMGAAAAVAWAAIATTAAAQQAAKRPMSIDDIMSLRTVGAAAISPDGAHVVYTVSGWEHPNAPRTAAPNDTARGDRHDMRSHLWLATVDGSRPPRQLTFGERGESQPSWSPDGSTIAFVAARGTPPAGEDAPRAQIHLLRLDGGEAQKLGDVPEGVSGYAWSPDGKRVAVLSVDSLPKDQAARRRRRDDPQVFEGDDRMSHVWVLDVATGQARELVHATEYTVRGTPAWSPDGTRLAYTTSPTTLIRDQRRSAFIVTVDSRAIERVEAAGDVQTAPQWSPDGRTLAFTTLPRAARAPADSFPEVELSNERLVLYDVASRRGREVSSRTFDIAVGAPQWSRDGRRIFFTAGDRAYSTLFSVDVAAGTYHRHTDKRIVRGISLARDGARMAMIVESSAEPGEVHVADVDAAGTAAVAPRRLTHTNPQLAALSLGESEVITWKSSDGQEVEGVLLKPVGWQPGRRYPLLVDIHGGPTGVHTAGFKAGWGSPGQYWAGQGWAVLYPNPRGSTNYGEKFMRGNVPDWGGGDYRDIMTGVDAVVQRGVADAARLAVTGWSYGGYMTNWVVTQTARFKAAMSGAGLSNIESMYGTTDIPGYLGTFFNGVPTARTMEVYRARSPITHVDKVTTPLLILHGGNDLRVPTGQAMEFYRALRDRGKPTQLVFYPREGHGLAEYYHQIDKIKRQYEWIARYTLGREVMQ